MQLSNIISTVAGGLILAGIVAYAEIPAEVKLNTQHRNHEVKIQDKLDLIISNQSEMKSDIAVLKATQEFLEQRLDNYD